MNGISKNKKLALSILFDAIGYLSFITPLAITDIIWAPLSAFILSKLYKGKTIKGFALFALIEELLPWSDVVPTFTITWVYVYYFDKSEDSIK